MVKSRERRRSGRGGGELLAPDASGLADDRLGVAGVLGCVMSAAAPLTVVAGVVTTAYAVTGNRALPAAFVLVTAVLLVFGAGYTAMSRHLPHTGAFYAYVAHGLGRAAGVGAAWVSVAAYNALQVGLYGLVGSATAPLIAGTLGVELPWWVSALLAWAVVGLLGILRVELSGRVLTALLVGEIAVLCLYDVAWLAHPAHPATGGTAGGPDWGLWSPARLIGPDAEQGIGAVLAIAVLGFVGFETTTVFAEEAKRPQRTIPIATYTAVAVIGALYGVSAWAMATATGPDLVAEQSLAHGPELPFVLAGAHLGPAAVTAGQVLFATSVLAAMISFHSTTSRYLFALGREGVLPSAFGRTTRTGAPRAGSLAQSALGLAVISVWAVAGWDPVLTLFYLAGTGGALGVLILLVVVALAVVGFFAGDRRGEPLWHTRIAPLAASLGLGLVLVLVVAQFALLIGVPESSPLRWGVPAAYLVVAAAGAGYGVFLALARPGTYRRIGRGARAVLASPSDGHPGGHRSGHPSGPGPVGDDVPVLLDLTDHGDVHRGRAPGGSRSITWGELR